MWFSWGFTTKEKNQKKKDKYRFNKTKNIHEAASPGGRNTAWKFPDWSSSKPSMCAWLAQFILYICKCLFNTWVGVTICICVWLDGPAAVSIFSYGYYTYSHHRIRSYPASSLSLLWRISFYTHPLDLYSSNSEASLATSWIMSW